MEVQITLSELLRELTSVLRGSVPSPELEAERIILEVCSLSREELISRLREQVSRELAERALEIARRRAEGYPLDYLLGWSYFRGMKLRVREGVFLPRPETEVLVDLAIRAVDRWGYETVLDVGTGTGCIALALKRERPHLRVTGVDVSPSAVQVAEENAQLLGLELELVEGDIRELARAWKGSRSFDLIVSNPPYVSPEWYRSHPELWHEPEEAFVYGRGPDFYELIAREVLPLLSPGGAVCLELGHEYQEEAIAPFTSRKLELVDEGHLNGLRVAVCLRDVIKE